MEEDSFLAKTRRKFTFLKKLDIFGLPVSLNLNGKKIYRSDFGGILSIITIFVLVIEGS